MSLVPEEDPPASLTGCGPAALLAQSSPATGKLDWQETPPEHRRSRRARSG